MSLVPCRLVTIVAEPLLEPRLLHDLRALGVRGWTITESRGQGSRQLRATDGGEGLRIEAVMGEATAERVLAFVAAHYFEHYAVIAWASPVEVVRGDKYV